jgi:carboxymethylenebutenolidase
MGSRIMIERRVDIDTPEGSMPTFIVHPEEGGPYPVVLYLMDAPSIRPALKDMASRLATVGYYVMLPYLFYRGGPYREFTSSDEDMHARRDLMGTVSPAGIVGDAQAMLDVAASDPMARDGAVGAVGFCMSGRLVVALAKARPDRLAAGASIHGAWVVSDADDSAHLGLDGVQAELYFGWADDDPTAPAEDMATMGKALTEAGVRHRIDFMEGALHGFAPPGGPRYDRAASEKHWERVLDLFRRNLWG